jgi:hypothetical protein
MMTEATKHALAGLRDLSTLQWYVIPILALVGYFWFFAWAILSITRKTPKGKIVVVAMPYALAIVLNLTAACLGWRY